MKPAVAINITRSRIETIESRTINTKLPKIEKVYDRVEGISGNFTKNLVEKMTFTDYPDAKINGAATLRAFLMNANNVIELKRSGSLGFIIESLSQLDPEAIGDTQYLMDLIDSIKVLTKDDKVMQAKLLSHPQSLNLLFKFCKFCDGSIQSKLFEILDQLRTLPNAISSLLNQGIYDLLLSPELMYRESTVISVKHGASRMTNSITSISPELFRPDIFSIIALNENGTRRIDGYMEMQLLSSLLNYLTWLENNNFELGYVFILSRHLINEIIKESFENLDHLHQIIKCLVILSKDQKQTDFMLEKSLDIALQFLVSTDFSMYQRKGVEVQAAKSSNVLRTHRVKKLSVQDTGDRPVAALMALSVIKPNIKINRSDDINHFATKSVVLIYENIVARRIEIITEIVSSGLIPALLYRMGKGSENDLRFNRITISFLYTLLIRVMINQTQKQFRIAIVGLIPGGKLRKQGLGGIVEAEGNKNENNPRNKLRAKKAKVDLHGISSMLNAQQVTQLLFNSLTLLHADEILLTAQAITCISIMSFDVIAVQAFKRENCSRLCFLASSRSECYFSATGIISEMILFPEVQDEVLFAMVNQHKVVKTLIKALRLSNWVFPPEFKDIIYKCFVKLSIVPTFRRVVSESEGVGMLCKEIKERRTRANRAEEAQNGDVADRLAVIFREDLHAMSIQRFVQKFLQNKKMKSRKHR